jgi:hypothetical protein
MRVVCVLVYIWMYAQTYASTVVDAYGCAYSNVDHFVTLALAVSPRIIHTL